MPTFFGKMLLLFMLSDTWKASVGCGGNFGDDFVGFFFDFFAADFVSGTGASVSGVYIVDEKLSDGSESDDLGKLSSNGRTKGRLACSTVGEFSAAFLWPGFEPEVDRFFDLRTKTCGDVTYNKYFWPKNLCPTAVCPKNDCPTLSSFSDNFSYMYSSLSAKFQ
jgi:hypothetical protein